MDRKIKVLWFCSDRLSAEKTNKTGTWLHSMSKGLMESGEVELFNITHAKIEKTIKEENSLVKQWILPISKLSKDGLPSKKNLHDIQKIVSEIQLDIIHVWGTESYWGLITARDIIKGKVLLEMQGLKYEICKYFYSGLSPQDLRECISLKDILRPSTSIFALKDSFSEWGELEKEMIKKHNYINTQSNWVRASIGKINNKAIKYNTLISLRNEFYEADKWNIEKCTRYRIFTSTSSVISYKGLHVLIDAMGILRKDFPKISLNIASSISKGIRQDGYTKFLFNKIKKNGLVDHINWLGPLTAQEIVNELHSANVSVIPSFIESYSVALEESLSLGVPTVASSAGAMPERGNHRETVSFFQPGNADECALEIKRIFENDDVAINLSNKAFNSRKGKKDNRATAEQIKIYRDILSK